MFPWVYLWLLRLLRVLWLLPWVAVWLTVRQVAWVVTVWAVLRRLGSRRRHNWLIWQNWLWLNGLWLWLRAGISQLVSDLVAWSANSDSNLDGVEGNLSCGLIDKPNTELAVGSAGHSEKGRHASFIIIVATSLGSNDSVVVESDLNPSVLDGSPGSLNLDLDGLTLKDTEIVSEWALLIHEGHSGVGDLVEVVQDDASAVESLDFVLEHLELVKDIAQFVFRLLRDGRSNWSLVLRNLELRVLRLGWLTWLPLGCRWLMRIPFWLRREIWLVVWLRLVVRSPSCSGDSENCGNSEFHFYVYFILSYE